MDSLYYIISYLSLYKDINIYSLSGWSVKLISVCSHLNETNNLHVQANTKKS